MKVPTTKVISGKFNKPNFNKHDLKCFHCGTTAHGFSKCKYKFSICNICKKKGHITYICKNRDENITGTNVIEMFTLLNNVFKPFLINGKINDILVTMEIDPGVGISVLSEKIFEENFGNLSVSCHVNQIKKFNRCIVTCHISEN